MDVVYAGTVTTPVESAAMSSSVHSRQRLRDDAHAIAGPEAESQEAMCQLAHAYLDL